MSTSPPHEGDHVRLKALTPADLDSAQAELYERIAGGRRAQGTQHFPLVADDGSLNGPFGVMLHAPGVGRSLADLGSAIRFETDMEGRLREIAILAVASVTDSAFERFAHERVGRAAGLTQHEIDALADGTFIGEDDQERIAHNLVRRLAAGDARLDDTEYAAASEVLGERLMIDVIVLTGYYVTLAHLLAVFEVAIP